LFITLASAIFLASIISYGTYKANGTNSFSRVSPINQVKDNNEILPKTEKSLVTNIDKPKSNTKSNKIQVALLLDTSGSMSGLIEQAKSQLWQILNQLAKTEKENDKETVLEVALYQYGSPYATRDKLQIQQLTPFTTDMDLISEKLFVLGTSGGDEYCGAVIGKSLSQLNWADDKDDLKMIFIAGNEPFTQGPIDFKSSCNDAAGKSIVVNTIFCGNWEEGIQTNWKTGADMTNGEYMNIDHNQKTTYIATPFDDAISELNEDLNKTYIPYGSEGISKQENQRNQDNNASSYSKSNVVERTIFKNSRAYKSSDWDLVDAYKDDKEILKNVDVKVDSLQNISTEELELKVQEMSTERKRIQKEIMETNMQREEYILNNAEEQTDNNLKNSILNAIDKQAKKKGFVKN